MHDSAGAASQGRTAAVLHPEVCAVVWAANLDVVNKLRADVAIECRTWGTWARFVDLYGDLVAELTAFAAEMRADLIVTGAPGGFLGRILPSLPNRAARRGRWPVMVVP